MDRPIESLINDYLAPEQPEDCREASRALLAEALKASGPVTHRGRTVSLGEDGATIYAEPLPPEEEPVAEPDPEATDDEFEAIVENLKQVVCPDAGHTDEQSESGYVAPNPTAQES